MFIGSFGFPWSYYPYFGYYPYDYYYPYGYYPYAAPYGYSGYAPYNDTVYPSGPVYSNDSEYYGDAPGSSQSLIAQVQRQLARDGYYKGEIDGIAGRRTYYAIRAYERAHGLRVDGAISDQLVNEMGLH